MLTFRHVRAGELPVFLGLFSSFQKASLLFLLRNVQKKLDNHDSVTGEVSFKAANVPEALLPNVLELKRASEGRKDRVIPLLSQAALEAVHYSRVMLGHPGLLAIVGANRIPNSIAEEAKQFMRERAPEVAVGVVDLEGLRLFAGHGLERLSSSRRPQSELRAPNVRARAPQLFSDLNQWMLKVLLAPRIPEVYLSAPRGRYQGASQLAEAAAVSVMSAFRFVEEFSKEGFLEPRGGVLRLVRLRELLNRWVAASQQRILEIPMCWVLHRGKKALRNAVRSYQSDEAIASADQFSSPRLRLCL